MLTIAQSCSCLRHCSVLLQFVGRDVLFRGLRVRMSVATGGIDAVRLHSVTQRAEYVGEVLRKVQAVGETPQGGQVRGWSGCSVPDAAMPARAGAGCSKPCGTNLCANDALIHC
jgi:hypothetical protein